MRENQLAQGREKPEGLIGGVDCPHRKPRGDPARRVWLPQESRDEHV